MNHNNKLLIVKPNIYSILMHIILIFLYFDFRLHSDLLVSIFKKISFRYWIQGF